MKRLTPILLTLLVLGWLLSSGNLVSGTKRAEKVSTQDEDVFYPRAPSRSAVPSPAEKNEETKTYLLPGDRQHIDTDQNPQIVRLPGLEEDASRFRTPNQIGIGRRLGISIREAGKVYLNSDGSRIRKLTITAPRAVGIKVQFEQFNLPEGDQLYVYEEGSKFSTGPPYLRKGPWENSEFWSGVIDGETVVIEHYIAARNPEVDFLIPQISHLYDKSIVKDFSPDAEACEINAMCHLRNEKDSVVRLVFTNSDGNTAKCTGTLMVNRAGTNVPYILTASHCISTQTEAQNTDVYWFYQATSCTNTNLRQGIIHSVLGADLLVTNTSADSTLLKLRGSVPAGAVYSGWDTAPPSLNSAIFSLHHPSSAFPPTPDSYLRISRGTLTNTAVPLGCITGNPSGYLANWLIGLTEPGSSGAGLWSVKSSGNYLIGVLSCGNDVSCDTYPQVTGFSKFSSFYPFIKKYLSPPIGYLESANCTQISGWAADRDRLNQSITVDIYDIHGSVIDVYYNVAANQPRSDVGAYLGDNGLHGFSFTIPGPITPGPHSYSVHDSTYNIELSNSPRSIACSSATPPTVNITSPTTGSTYSTNSSSIVLAGSAAGNASILQVTWTNSRGGTGVANGTVNWNSGTITLQPGNNLLTIRAQDQNGSVGSDSLTVVYSPLQSDSTPPTIEITAPTTNPTFSSGGNTLTVRGTSWDNMGVTQVTWVNDRGGSGTANGTTNWTANITNLQTGQNVITVKARDGVGNIGSDSISVNYTPPPTCGGGSSVTYRVNNGPPIHANGTLVASQNDPGTAYVIVNGQKRGIPTPTILNNLYNQSNGGFQFREIITIAQDEFTNYPTGPVVTSALPSNGRSQPNGRLIRKPGGTEIAIVNNGQRSPFASEGAFLGLGYLYCNVVDVADYDSYPVGNLADSITTLKLATVSPVSIQMRDWGSTVNYSYQVVDGNNTPVSGAIVGGGDTLRGIVFIGTMSTDANGNGTYATFVPTGTPNRVFDIIFLTEKTGYTKSDAITRQVLVDHFVDSTPPTIGITSPVAGATYTTSNNVVSLAGGSADDVGVSQVKWTNDRGGNGTANGSNSWSTGNISLQAGPNVITVTAFDAAGNIASAVLTVVLATGAPDVESPTLGATNIYDGEEVTSRIITLTGTASDAGLGDNGISSVLVGGVRANGDTVGGSGTAFWSRAIELQPGVNTIALSARDGSSGQNSTTRTITVRLTPSKATSFDFDGDGRTDVATWRRNSGHWNILNSSSSLFTSIQWGSGSSFADLIVPGDYDGDYRTDVAVWRPGSGTWYILNSSNNTFTGIVWGHVDYRDVPIPGDFDGDKRTDIAVWRKSTGVWYILRSSDGQLEARQFGLGGDLPIVGDYDGDGKADVGSWRPSSGYWYILRSSDNLLLSRQWGNSEDVILPACDFDGDGVDDLAVWRQSSGIWYILRSVDSGLTAVQWGGPQLGDMPVAGDYDGDGRADPAVWRMPTGTWYILKSSNGQTLAQPWGNQDFSDQAVPSAYIRFVL